MLSFSNFVFLLENRIEFLKKQSGLPHETVDKLASHDPSEKKEYTQWLIRRHKKGDFDANNDEHMKKVGETLGHFHTLKTRFPNHFEGHKDINQYKSYDEMEDAVHPYLGNKVYDKNGYTAHVAETPHQAMYHACDAGWCTGDPKGGHVQNYLKGGPLTIFKTPNKIAGGKAEKYQWWHGDGKEPELQDQDRSNVEPYQLERQHPEVLKVPGWHDFKHDHENHEREPDPQDDDYYDEDDPHNWAHHEDYHMRIDAVNRGLHREYDHLYHDPEPEVRKAIIDHEQARGFTHRDNVHEHYKDDDDDEVLGHVAQHAVHPGIINHMVDHHFDVDEVKEGLAANEHITHEHAMKLATDGGNRYVRNNLSENPVANAEVHHAILDHGHNDHQTYHNILQHEDSDPRLAERIHQFAKDGSQNAMHALALHDPVKYKETIQKSENPNTHWYVARHFPLEYIHHENRLIRSAVVEHAYEHGPAVAQKIYDHAVDDPDESVVKVAARNTTNPEHLPKLENHYSWDVRNAVADRYERNGNHDGLARMVTNVRTDHEAWRLSSRIISRIETPSMGLMNAAARSSHSDMREIAARMGHDGHREDLKNDPNPSVALTVAQRGTAAQRAHIANHHPDPQVRFGALRVQRMNGEVPDADVR